MKKAKVKVKLKRVDTRGAQVKCEEMFGILGIDKNVGNSAVRALIAEMKVSLKPMGGLADRAVEFFKDKLEDRHTSILLAVFSLVFSRILFDPSVACVTVTEKKGDKDNEQERTSKDSK